MADDVLHSAVSVHGNMIRLTAKQWAHITEAHDYMAGNQDKLLETLAEPTRIVQGEQGESIALRDYEKTSISQKTAVVIYRDIPDGFVITAFFTSKPGKVERNKEIIWRK